MKIRIIHSIIASFLLISFLGMAIEPTGFAENPFFIDFPKKKELSNDDYLLLQEKLRQINLIPLLKELCKDKEAEASASIMKLSHEDSILLQNKLKEMNQYKKNGESINNGGYNYFYSRCTKFLHQTFIDQERGLIPKKELIKINEGGDGCLVGSVPYGADYPALLTSQINAIKETGFNGYYLAFFGAYPNPTGQEIVYAGVPYAFKIFAMIEAQNMGFNHVLWLDSALYPKRNIQPIFDEIERTGFIIHHKQSQERESMQLFSSTRDLLKKLTSVDVLKGRRIFATMIGLKMNHPLTKSLIKQYYELVVIGTPFISGLPEEFVLSSILGQNQYSEWMKASTDYENTLLLPCYRQETEAPGRIPDEGYFFEWRSHAWVPIQ